MATHDDDPPDDPDLVAYLDGELEEPDALAVERQLATDPAARSKADALRKTFDLLDVLPKPEPSPQFASRTLTRIDSNAAAVPAFAPSGTSVSVPALRKSRTAAFAWLAAGVVAAAGGFAAHAVAPNAAVREPELSYADVRVVENLPLYLGVDDLAFAKRLDDPDLFAADDGPADPRPAAPEPVSPEYRDKLIKQFRAYPPARQQQVRQLHQELNDLAPGPRDRLTAVIERYAVWLDRLPDADRAEVLAVPSASDRLDVVRRVKFRAWRDALPPPVRDRIRTAEPADQGAIVAAVRTDELNRHSGWDLARRQWDAIKTQKKPWPFSDEALAKQVDEYVTKVLRPRLSPGESGSLDKLAVELARDGPAEGKVLKCVEYGALVYGLTEEHPYLPPYKPGITPVRKFDELDNDFLRKLKGPPLGNARLALRQAPQFWPEFAERVAREAIAAKVSTEKLHLGPSKPEDFDPAVAAFTAEFLPTLSVTEQGELKKLEGKWPEYPKRLVDLAKKKNLSVPGVTLPGPPDEWAKYYRPVRAAKK